ncbi:MAG: c-type cytochrome biogenesis protein CcsB [Calditerrivibrio sp.]|nr:c-type cytochrome biogenesis protein CcsB [Calditerrivibrio sp.]
MNDSLMFGVASLMYLLSMFFYIVHLFVRKKMIGLLATYTCFLGFIIHTVAFLGRWYHLYVKFNMPIIQSIPITNLYESLLFFAWSIILGNFIIEKWFKTRLFGAFITAIAGMSIAFVDAVGASKLVQPVLPALKSNWLLAHASLSFLAYAAFTLSFSAAIVNLATKCNNRKSMVYLFWTLSFSVFIYTTGIILTNVAFKLTKGTNLLKAFEGLGIFLCLGFFVVFAFVWILGVKIGAFLSKFIPEQLSIEMVEFRFISIGFLIFTIGGLVFGAIWADISWGRYWAWDPKETWAFVTWLVYAFYLHMRLIRGYDGLRSSVLAVIGFLITIFTYIGVNLLMPGLHSYGGM